MLDDSASSTPFREISTFSNRRGGASWIIGDPVLSIVVLLVGGAATPVPPRGRDAAVGGTRRRRAQGGAAPLVRADPAHADGTYLGGAFSGMGSGLTHTVILEDHTRGSGLSGGKSLIIDPADGVIPYQPLALVERDRRREDINAYEDPVGHCEFYDIGRLHSFAQRFMYSGSNIVIAAQEQIVRIIDMDRKQHLPASIRLWLGIRSAGGRATRWSSTRPISTARHAWRWAATTTAPTRTSSSASP